MTRIGTSFVIGTAGCLALALVPAVPAVASPPDLERGTWHWSGHRDNHPFGSAQAIGNPEREREILDIYRRWNITRVYTSYYGDRLERERDVIGRWNATLHNDGRTSFLLLSTTRWIFEDQRDDLRRALQTLLLDFNASRVNPAERFRGLHFDVEPHILPEWKAATPQRKREMLLLLRDMYADARAFLNENGAEDLPIYAAIPVWIDRMPPELGGRGGIGWTSEAERDAWFRHVGENVAALSLMAFETPHVRTILNNAAWERDHFKGEVIIALRADLGTEWKEIEDMLAAMADVEAATGEGIDLQPFRFFAERAGDRSPKEFRIQRLTTTEGSR